jgi:hypothetical protein
MATFHPEKLTTTIVPPATPYWPIDDRKYTLTHSDKTGQLLLTIGLSYDEQAINQQMRNEVLAYWSRTCGEYELRGRVYVSQGEFDENLSMIRYHIFKRELPLALAAIINGDNKFYTYYPWLLDVPIYIEFISIYPQFQQCLYLGTPRQYLQKRID